MVPGTIDEAGESRPPGECGCALADRGVLGMPVERDECATYLERLGFAVASDGEDLVAEVPFDRHYDVSREVDLVEEVGRIHGYDEHLPATLPAGGGQGGRLTREQALRRRAEDVLRDLGFDAVVSLSLVDPDLPRACGWRRTIPGASRSGSRTRSRSSTPSSGRRFSARCWTPHATTSPGASSGGPV